MKKSKESQESLAAKRTPCEVFSRIVGYIRPIKQWNPGKYAEYFERKTYTNGLG
jgi:anaerobic ribonucleoside-triphosphate reductase